LTTQTKAKWLHEGEREDHGTELTRSASQRNAQHLPYSKNIYQDTPDKAPGKNKQQNRKQDLNFLIYTFFVFFLLRQDMYVAQASLELTISCLNLLNAGITEVHCHTQLAILISITQKYKSLI
jgi:hypothetical protein